MYFFEIRYFWAPPFRCPLKQTNTGAKVYQLQRGPHLELPPWWIVPNGCETRCGRFWLCLRELLHFLEEFHIVAFQRPPGLVARRTLWKICIPGIQLVILTSFPSVLSYPQKRPILISICICYSSCEIYVCNNMTFEVSPKRTRNSLDSANLGNMKITEAWSGVILRFLLLPVPS